MHDRIIIRPSDPVSLVIASIVILLPFMIKQDVYPSMKKKKASKGNKFFLSGVSSAFFLELLTNTYETKGLCPPWNEWKIERERGLQ